MSQAQNRYSVPAVERSFIVLELLSEASRPLGITDLAAATGWPKSSLFMILSTFEEHGFASRDETGKYRLTLKIYNLAMKHLSQLEVRDVARPVLEQLAVMIGLTVHLAVLAGGKAVYIDKIEGPGFVQFATRVGQSFDLHLSGTGKALAAWLSESELDAILEEHGMPVSTPNTMTSKDAFKQFLSTVKQVGYAIEDEEGEMGIRCIGAPIFNHDGRVIASLSVTALRNDLPSIKFTSVGETVKSAGLNISRELGYEP